MALPFEMMKKRADFVHAARGTKAVRAGFVLQYVKPEDETGSTRFGFTTSKKIGNAPQRNRVKRRLRALILGLDREKLPQGRDFVLVGRRAALYMDFDKLQRDLNAAVNSVIHKGAN